MKLESEILDSYQVVMRFDDTTRQAAESLYNQYKSKQHEQMVSLNPGYITSTIE